MDNLPEREYVHWTKDREPMQLCMPTDRRQEELRKLAIADAVLWAEENEVTVGPRPGGPLNWFKFVANIEGQFGVLGQGYHEAINNLRAKLEPDMTKGQRNVDREHGVAAGGGVRLSDVQTKPDKRVPAELLRSARMHLHARGQETLAKQLEACPDIVDEPATLDPTVQAVLSVLGAPEFDEEAFKRVARAWMDAGRPTVVGAGEDPTLAALNECRELGLEVNINADGSARVSSERWDDDEVGDNVREALAAYKAAQAPEVEDGWYWARGKCYYGEYQPIEFKNGRSVGYDYPVVAYDIRDRLPDRPEEI